MTVDRLPSPARARAYSRWPAERPLRTLLRRRSRARAAGKAEDFARKGKRTRKRKLHTDRLTVDLAELSIQVSFARAGRISRELAGTGATARQAHTALADTAALLSGANGTHPAAGGPATPHRG